MEFRGASGVHEVLNSTIVEKYWSSDFMVLQRWCVDASAGNAPTILHKQNQYTQQYKRISSNHLREYNYTTKQPNEHKHRYVRAYVEKYNGPTRQSKSHNIRTLG